MSCRHDFANTTCAECYPDTGGEIPYGPSGSMNGPGAVENPEPIRPRQLDQLSWDKLALIKPREGRCAECHTELKGAPFCVFCDKCAQGLALYVPHMATYAMRVERLLSTRAKQYRGLIGCHGGPDLREVKKDMGALKAKYDRLHAAHEFLQREIAVSVDDIHTLKSVKEAKARLGRVLEVVQRKTDPMERNFFRCPSCNLDWPYTHGAADAHPDLCNACANAATEIETFTKRIMDALGAEAEDHPECEGAPEKIIAAIIKERDSLLEIVEGASSPEDELPVEPAAPQSRLRWAIAAMAGYAAQRMLTWADAEIARGSR